MSRNNAYKVDPASLMTLCPVCLHSFQDARKAGIPYDPVSGLSALVSGRQESIPAPGRRSPADQGYLYLLPEPLWF